MSLLMAFAIVGAVVTVVFNFLPFGKPTHSGTRHGRNEPPTKWTEEAAFWVPMLNPVRIVGDLVRGYVSIGDTFLRLLMLGFVGATLWTAGFVIWVASNA